MKLGIEFENAFNKELKKIEKENKGFFIKSPTPMQKVLIDGKFKTIYSQKALCDFFGIVNKKFILIELKTISTKSFELRRLKNHQIKQLESIHKFGGISLIFFKIKNRENIILVEIQKYLDFIKKINKKSLKIEEIEKIGKKLKLNEIKNYLN